MSKRESRNILIITLIVAAIAVCGSLFYNKGFMGIGYSDNLTAKWKLGITDISICTLSDQAKDNRCQAIFGNAENVVAETFVSENDSLNATFTALLGNTEDSITYKVVVKNSGSLKGKLTGIKFEKVYNDPVIFTYNNIEEGIVLEPGESRTFYVMASYISDQSSEMKKYDNTLVLTFALAE